MSVDADRQPFSHRYGIADPLEAAKWDTQTWRFRHCADIVSGLPDQMWRCICPSWTDRPQCAERASQEDRLCDVCRDHCVAVDTAGRYHSLLSVYGIKGTQQ